MAPLSREANETVPSASVFFASSRRCPSRQSKRQRATSAPEMGSPRRPEDAGRDRPGLGFLPHDENEVRDEEIRPNDHVVGSPEVLTGRREDDVEPRLLERRSDERPVRLEVGRRGKVRTFHSAAGGVETSFLMSSDVGRADQSFEPAIRFSTSSFRARR